VNQHILIRVNNGNSRLRGVTIHAEGLVRVSRTGVFCMYNKKLLVFGFGAEVG